MRKPHNPKHLSLLGMVNFYRSLYKKGKLEHGSAGYNRMTELETKLRLKRNTPKGRRITI